MIARNGGNRYFPARMNKPLAPMTPESAAKARFSKEEFLAMASLGAFDDMSIELVDGELERMNPPMSEHGRLQGELTYLLRHALAGTSMVVLGETGIDLGGQTVRSCDAAVLSAPLDENRLLRPDDVALLIEIGLTTVERDMGAKRIDYARAGVRHYWVVDGERRVVHLFAEPLNGDYADVRSIKFGAPLTVPGSDRVLILG
ncbi:Uma2 family endonuclease [Sphingomonas sanxanigenens]|nr:Uma2 family endonuclease [Sphingomonas sanxanigenens]